MEAKKEIKYLIPCSCSEIDERFKNANKYRCERLQFFQTTRGGNLRLTSGLLVFNMIAIFVFSILFSEMPDLEALVLTNDTQKLIEFNLLIFDYCYDDLSSPVENYDFARLIMNDSSTNSTLELYKRTSKLIFLIVGIIRVFT